MKNLYKMRIILDTNFIVDTIKNKIDFMKELERICDFNFEIFVLDKTLYELRKIKKPESKIALFLIRNFNIIDTSKYKDKDVDDILFELGSKYFIIATQDKELKRKLRKKSIQVIIIRQKKYYKFA